MRMSAPELSAVYAVKAAGIFGVVLAVAFTFRRAYHPLPSYGPANLVTTLRAAMVALVAALIGESRSSANGLLAAALSIVVTALDGVDGWLARRTRMVSTFGARFDMEVDALLILVLAILAWQYQKAGWWIVMAGLLRYLFVAAGSIFDWMNYALPPSRRRQTICVVQIAGSSALMIPAAAPPSSTAVAAALLALLSCSFLVDVLWLWRRRNPST